MKKISIFCLCLAFWIQSSAQKLDKLVVGKDTTSCQLKISQRRGERVILFKNSYQLDWNEIYADNADAAIVSDESLFVSILLPDARKKVWAKCFFDGAYKLLQYRGEFYIVAAGEVTRLKERNKKTEGADSGGAKVFIGQMIFIFHDKIDYNFNLLTYGSKSLVVPLIKYHEANQLQYRDYNRYIKVNKNWSFNGGFSLDNYNLSTQSINSIEIAGFSSLLGTNININLPQLSNRLSFSGGIEVSGSYLDAMKIRSFNGNTYYFNLSYRGLNLSVPVMARFKLMQKPGLDVSLASGLKVVKGFSLDQSLTVETEKDNVVRTELENMESISGVKLFHCSELLLGIPTISKSISLGAAYNYSLSNKTQVNNTVSLDRSMSVFARFNF